MSESVRKLTPNQAVQATPGIALDLCQPFGSGVPDLSRSAEQTRQRRFQRLERRGPGGYRLGVGSAQPEDIWTADAQDAA